MSFTRDFSCASRILDVRRQARITFYWFGTAQVKCLAMILHSFFFWKGCCNNQWIDETISIPVSLLQYNSEISPFPIIFVIQLNLPTSCFELSGLERKSGFLFLNCFHNWHFVFNLFTSNRFDIPFTTPMLPFQKNI